MVLIFSKFNSLLILSFHYYYKLNVNYLHFIENLTWL